jgi:putative ATP-binding cassette transporter
MSEEKTTIPVEKKLLRRFLLLSMKFWRGPSRGKAWFLSLAFLAALLANMLLAVGVNRWSKYFFDAIQDKNLADLEWSVGLILVLAAGTAVASVALVQSRMRLQLRWREWLTNTLVARWLAKRRFYQLSILGAIDNPEARMAEDARLSVELFVDLAGGIINTLLLSASFIVVLWYVGGAITVGGVTIPGYLVIAVIAYTGLTSFGMYKLARPLVARVEDKAAREGDFRYALTRTRENAEAIALIGGDEDERKALQSSFSEVARRWIQVIGSQTRMMFLSSGNNVIAAAIPLLLGAPKYLAGEMSLGDLMQAAAAFAQVQTALNWLADNALSLANWSASARRVAELDSAFGNLDRLTPEQDVTGIVLEESVDGALHLIALSISQHDGTIMLTEANTKIEMGDKVLVRGDSGSGKSTLIRAVAGLWPWGTGRILSPLESRVAFMPQRPYMPLGTLRVALSYPDDGQPISDEDIAKVLEECGLEHLMPRLDEDDNWSGILSGGELQRLAFARVFLKKPAIIIMDEATSALDELSQKKMMELMGGQLEKSMVIHVAHRPGLERYHTRELVLKREMGGPATMNERDEKIEFLAKGLVKRILRPLRGGPAAPKTIVITPAPDVKETTATSEDLTATKEETSRQRQTAQS